MFIGRTDVEAETPILWPPAVKSWLIERLWCWERLKAGGERDNRGWDSWMALLIQWTWVWVNSWSWQQRGRCGVLQAIGSHRVRHDWSTELSMAPPIRTRPSFPLSQSVPSGSVHKPPILLHLRIDILKTTITENQPIRSLGPRPCLTQWNYEPCYVGPPKTDGSWWRVMTKRGPLEKGMANHFTILASRTP